MKNIRKSFSLSLKSCIETSETKITNLLDFFSKKRPYKILSFKNFHLFDINNKESKEHYI